MFSSLLVAATLTAPAAPLPRDTVPNLSGPAPRIVSVKADKTGKVWLTGNTYTKRMVKQSTSVMENGKRVVKQKDVERLMATHFRKELGDFGEKFTTAEGLPLSVKEVTDRVKDGATLLITADGKPVDPSWLRTVSRDTVIMIAEGLGDAYFTHGNSVLYPNTATPRLVMLSANEKGEVRLPVNPNNLNGNNQVFINNGVGGVRVINRGVIIQNGVQQVIGGGAEADASTKPAAKDGKKALEDIAFDAYDTTGAMIPRATALKRLSAGGMAIIAGDDRFPDETYLTGFRKDVIVIVSNELVFPAGVTNPFDVKSADNKAAEKNAAKLGLIPPPAPGGVVEFAKPAVIKQVEIQIQNQK